MAMSLKTECKWGHPLSGSNLHIKPDGSRRCLACHSEQKARYREPGYQPGADIERMKCGHLITNKSVKHGCHVCRRSKQNEYNGKRRLMLGGTEGYQQRSVEASQSSRSRRFSARKAKMLVLWRGRVLGTLVEDMDQKVRYQSPYGYVAGLPKCDWLTFMPAAEAEAPRVEQSRKPSPPPSPVGNAATRSPLGPRRCNLQSVNPLAKRTIAAKDTYR